MRFLIRCVEKKDLHDFYRLASQLDTYNLPKDRRELSKIINLSINSFSGQIKDPQQGRFVFVAEDLKTSKIIGTAEVLAKRGTPDEPFIYCDVGVDRMRSKTLSKEVTHRYIRLRHTSNGASEVGGLVVDPGFRGKGSGVGKALSYVRLMYTRGHPERFEKYIIAELLAYLDARGENPLWNFLGRHFTGLSYHDADHLSVHNKEFILSLFPSEKIYTCLLPQKVQDILEKPGLHSIPAQVLLQRIGFKYFNQVDPFDGGPLYGCEVRKTKVYRETESVKAQGILQGESNPNCLMMVEQKSKVRAVLGECVLDGKNARLDIESMKILKLSRGDKFWAYFL